METSNFELNINNYSISDLFHLFQVTDNLQLVDTMDIDNFYIGLLNQGFTKEVEEFFNIARKRLRNYIDDKKLENIKLELTRDIILETERKRNEENKNNDKPTSAYNTLPIIKTLPQKFEYGRLNKLYKQTYTTVLNINTRERPYEKGKQANPANYIFAMDHTIKNVISMRLTSIEYPSSIYLFKSQNPRIQNSIASNTFTIITRENTNALNEEHIITIPDGNYNTLDLATELNKTFTTTQVTSGGILSDYIKIEYDLRFNKFVFNKSDNDTAHEFDLKFFDIYTKYLNIYSDNRFAYQVQKCLGWIIGYCRKSDDGFPKIYYSYSEDYETEPKKENSDYIGYIPEALFNSGGTNYLYLSINDYNNNMHPTHIKTNFLGEKNMTNVLARIPQAVGRWDIGFDDASDRAYKKREYYGPVNLEKFHIQLLDEYGEIAELNETNYSFALELECIYDV